MTVRAFYDDLSDWYHLIYADWDASVARQGAALTSLIQEFWPDPTIYERDEIMGEENGQPMPTRWIPLEQFGNGTLRLYPHGLFDLLRTAAG